MTQEAFYHLHVKKMGRQNSPTKRDRDIVAAAAYRSGVSLKNDKAGKTSSFVHKANRVLYAELIAPDFAPSWMKNREELWNKIEQIEKRKDALLAYEIEFALPDDLSKEKMFLAVHEMAAYYVNNGHVVDVSVHTSEDGDNPHVHMLLSTRVITEEGFGNKIRAMDKKSFLYSARQTWEKIGNKWLKASGSDKRMSSKSYVERSIPKTPTRHRGPDRQERTLKREKFQQRQEQKMKSFKKPVEVVRYPNLTKREDWPPSVDEPFEHMTPAEMEEYSRWCDEYNKERTKDPVPGPYNRPYCPDALEEAQDKMLEEHEREVKESDLSPAPTKIPEEPQRVNAARVIATDLFKDITYRAPLEPPTRSPEAREKTMDDHKKERLEFQRKYFPDSYKKEMHKIRAQEKFGREEARYDKKVIKQSEKRERLEERDLKRKLKEEERQREAEERAKDDLLHEEREDRKAR